MKSDALEESCIQAMTWLVNHDISQVYEDTPGVVLKIPSDPGRIAVICERPGSAQVRLLLFRGEEALHLFTLMRIAGPLAPLMVPESEFLRVGVARLERLDPEDLVYVIRPDACTHNLVPWVQVHPHSEERRPADRRDLETILYAISAIRIASRSTRILGTAEADVLPRLQVVGNPEDPEVQLDLLDIESGETVEFEELLEKSGRRDPYAIPDATDRKAWLEVVFDAELRHIVAGKDESLANKRALEIYYGKGSSYVVEEDGDPYREGCYLDWYLLEYRRHPTDPLLLERVLEAEIKPPLRVVHQAMLDGWSSWFQVSRSEPGHYYIALDLCTGREWRIVEPDLLLPRTPGLITPMRVFRIGDLWMGMGLGQSLDGLLRDNLFEELARHGWTDADKSLDGKAHLVGRLWDFHRAASKRRDRSGDTKVFNTDGDEISDHKVSLGVSDAEALLHHLADRDDIVSDRSSMGWMWIRPSDATPLGSMDLIGDELLLEVNSEERFQEARLWLEEIPGVVFKDFTIHHVSKEPFENDPLDDHMWLRRPPRDFPAEHREVLEGSLREYWMSWLDVKLRSLDNRTPREACATEEGRRKMRRLIRDYRDTFRIRTLPPPRDEWRAELGLDDEESED